MWWYSIRPRPSASKPILAPVNQSDAPAPSGGQIAEQEVGAAGALANQGLFAHLNPTSEKPKVLEQSFNGAS